MSKTKTKSKELTLSKVDPRVRMKEVRAAVASAHKQGRRVDLMCLTGDNVARSQIALQDLLSNEQKRHAKARGHIVSQKEMIQALSEMVGHISDHSMQRLVRDQERMGHMTEELRATSAQNNLLHQNLDEALNKNAQLTADLEATMNSLRVALNGSTDD